MKLSDFHTKDKELSAGLLFTGEKGTVTSIQLKANASLKEHITKSQALLLCVTGVVVYEDETSQKIELLAGDYVNIIPNVKHWLVADTLSQLVLLK